MHDIQPCVSVSPSELNTLVTRSGPAELLDVRSPAEFCAAHVPGAKLVPLDELDAAEYLRRRADADKPIYVICHAGGRARKAIEKFRAAGFEGCVLVEGGTQAWVQAGLPVYSGS